MGNACSDGNLGDSLNVCNDSDMVIMERGSMQGSS